MVHIKCVINFGKANCLWGPFGCFILLLQLGCAPKITNVNLPVDTDQGFSHTGLDAMPEKWWTAFNDPKLNTLIDSVLRSNLDLAATWQQFRAAQAVVRREAGDKWPQVEASVQNALRRPEPDFAGGENLQLGLSAAYEIDLWGRIRTGIEAENYRAVASLEDYRTVAMSLSAELGLTWFRLVASKNQLALAEKQIKTNEDIVKLIRARFGSGQIRAVDILRQTQLLEATKNEKIRFETNVTLLENQLAVLLGKSPQQRFPYNAVELPELPAMPETGLPLDLVRRRPDVQRTYNLLLAADRDMASAVRNKYPRLSVDLAGQLRSNNFDSLFKDWAYSLGGNLLAPLFYGGSLSAEADRTEAVKRQRLYQYGQSVLEAFREVEDALVQELKQTERLGVLKRQLDLAKKTNAQLRIEFLNGLTPYLDVLLSLDQEQQLRRDLIDAQLTQLEIRIALYRALAGGFETGRSVNP